MVSSVYNAFWKLTIRSYVIILADKTSLTFLSNYYIIHILNTVSLSFNYLITCFCCCLNSNKLIGPTGVTVIRSHQQKTSFAWCLGLHPNSTVLFLLRNNTVYIHTTRLVHLQFPTSGCVAMKISVRINSITTIFSKIVVFASYKYHQLQ